MSHKVDIVLGHRAIASTVAIDGIDVTASIIGLEVSAHVNALTKVTLFLSCAVDVKGEAGEMFKVMPTLEPTNAD